MRRSLTSGAVALATLGTALCASAQDYNLFHNYTPMNLPRGTVPVGAKWVPGTGPTGPALPADELVEAESLDSTVINATLKRNLTFSLAKYLGLSADQATKLDASFDKVTVTRVADLSRVSHVRAGEQILFEAVKAGRIRIKTTSDLAAKIEASAAAQNIPITAQASGGGNSTIALDGSELFIAYQVLAFGAGKATSKTVKHRGGEVTIDNTYRFRFCQCAPGQTVRVEVQDLTAPNLDGTFDTQVISFDPERERLNEYNLKPHYHGDTVTAARVFFRYLATQKCSPMGSIIDPQGRPMRLCGEVKFPREQNDIRLTRTTFRIAPVTNPSTNY